MIRPLPSEIHVGIITAFFSKTTGVVCHDTGYALPIQSPSMAGISKADEAPMIKPWRPLPPPISRGITASGVTLR